jgi:hypothetical protein
MPQTRKNLQRESRARGPMPLGNTLRAGATASLALFLAFSCGGQKEAAAPAESLQSGEPPTVSAQAPPNALTGEERAGGWLLLWNGIDFAGWRGVGLDSIPQGHWLIEDHAIRKLAAGEVPRQADGQPVQGGDLMTTATFQDFDLSFEWKISAAGNSGLKYNVSEDISKAHAPLHAAIGFEYQCLDDTASYEPAILPNQTTASLYDLVPAGPKTLKPVGEWNASRVVFRGGHGEHWLNGAKVVEFDLGTPEMEARVAASKFKSIPGFADSRPGHIVLQDHGSAVWFRSIKVRPLVP